MEFRLLGAASVVTETGGLPLGPVKRRSLLATLLLRPNYPVLVDHLTTALWEQEPPARPQCHPRPCFAVGPLTSVDAGAHGVELVTQGPAYVLRMPKILLDVHRFEDLVARTREQRGPAEAVTMCRETLSLWQGPALADVCPSPPLLAAAQALEELRLAAAEQLAAGCARLGDHAGAATVLRAEAVAHPLRESLSVALMEALQRAGRRSEALDWFHRTRVSIGRPGRRMRPVRLGPRRARHRRTRRRAMANTAFGTPDALDRKLRREIRRIQLRPHLSDGCLAATGLTLAPPTPP